MDVPRQVYVPLVARFKVMCGIGLFEAWTIDDNLSGMIAAGASHDQLREAASATDRIGMRENALRKILAGIITLDDAKIALYRVPECGEEAH